MRRRLAAGIIAAGRGSRLQESHRGLIKPLIPVAGAPLCHWVTRSLQGAGISDITLLHNSQGAAVEESLRQAFPALRWTFLEADTSSSWESFRLLSKTLAGASDAFLVSTVDALIAPRQTGLFARAMSESAALAGLALTDFIDDEKPLWAEMDSSGLITALGPSVQDRRLATAGLYYATSSLAAEMAGAPAFSSLRDYLGSLVKAGRPLRGLTVAKALDVDRPQDLRQAEDFLKAAGPSW
jgi:NDP-sugar pyrophosphorylase family protein